MTIFLKLYWCFCHGVKMCMWFGYNPQINFCHFFRILNLVIFSGANTIKVYRQWVPCVRNSFYSFMSIFLKLYKCFCHGLKMCMWFGYNPQINFCHFFAFWTWSFFKREYYQKVYITDTLCAQLLLQFYADPFKTLQMFLSWSEEMHVVWILFSD